jgi:hypothetical protein
MSRTCEYSVRSVIWWLLKLRVKLKIWCGGSYSTLFFYLYCVQLRILKFLCIILSNSCVLHKRSQLQCIVESLWAALHVNLIYNMKNTSWTRSFVIFNTCCLLQHRDRFREPLWLQFLCCRSFVIIASPTSKCKETCLVDEVISTLLFTSLDCTTCSELWRLHSWCAKLGFSQP